jgi:hypothetical protein
MKGKRTGKAGAVAAAQEGAKEAAVAAAQEVAKEVAAAGAAWGAEEQHREQRRADCWAFGSGVGVYSGVLLRRVFLWFCGVSAFGSAVRYISGTHVCSLHAGFDFCHSCVLPRLPCCLS